MASLLVASISDSQHGRRRSLGQAAREGADDIDNRGQHASRPRDPSVDLFTADLAAYAPGAKMLAGVRCQAVAVFAEPRKRAFEDFFAAAAGSAPLDDAEPRPRANSTSVICCTGPGRNPRHRSASIG